MVRLDCEICMREYKNDESDQTPRLLPCGHTICELCAGNLVNHNEYAIIMCPFDRRMIYFDGDVKELPKNFALLNVLEDLQKEREAILAEAPRIMFANHDGVVIPQQPVQEIDQFVREPEEINNVRVYDENFDMNAYLNNYANGYILFRQPSPDLDSDEDMYYESEEEEEQSDDDEDFQNFDAFNAFANFNIEH
uniref:RING-type domain-containing protein n=1 Tax=Caenorhabditis tropicalis TaxID=1561998 RepID=A0A1I7TJR3_9PELO